MGHSCEQFVQIKSIVCIEIGMSRMYRKNISRQAQPDGIKFSSDDLMHIWPIEQK